MEYFKKRIDTQAIIFYTSKQMNENVDGESTFLKLAQEKGSLAERTFKFMDGKLLLSAANHCRKPR